MRNGGEDGGSGLTCADVQRTLLEAPLETLGEGGAAHLARHLAVCPACRARARWIREGEAALRDAMVRTGPRMGPDDAKALAKKGRVGSGEVAETEARGAPGPTRRHRRRPLGWKVAIPVAAAAAALFVGQAVFRAPAPDRVPRPPITYQEAEPATRVHVEAPPDVRTVLLTTPDPRFTVVWLY